MRSKEKKKRQFSRYQVMECGAMKAWLGGVSSRKLKTLAEGGCGFLSVSDFEADPVVPPQYLEIEIEISGEDPVQLKGEVLYVSLNQVGEKMLRYYGVQFCQMSRSTSRALAKHLERLADQGELIKEPA